jgi:hypothetical protein
MVEEKTPWYQKPLQVGITTVILTSLTPIFLDWFKGIKVGSTFSLIFNWLVNVQLSIIYLIPITILICSIPVFWIYRKNKKLSTIKDLALQLSETQNQLNKALEKQLNEFKVKNSQLLSTPKPKLTHVTEIESIVNYQGEQIDGLTWKWNWRKNPITKNFEPYDARPLCNVGSCDYRELITNNVESPYGYRTFACPRCKKDYYALPSIKDITNKILTSAARNVAKWKK